jgi:hypothetical protein
VAQLCFKTYEISFCSAIGKKISSKSLYKHTH